MRRAIRHGYKLGVREPFFHRLVTPLVTEMGAAYPELREAAGRVATTIRQEEDRFAETLEHGMALLERDLAQLTGNTIPGETVFRLYDTYGFPVDLTADIARENGLAVDMAGFDQAMAQQRERARAASQFGAASAAFSTPEHAIPTPSEFRFTGYDALTDQGQVFGLLRDGQPVEALEAGDDGAVILEQTPFYAESGGQVGDTGRLFNGHVRFEVRDTQKRAGVHVHLGKVLSGRLATGAMVQAEVDAARRQAIVLNHSATHLLHAALRQVLGGHVQQKGSLVAPDRLRFDFSHNTPLGGDELQRIEQMVNAEIRRNIAADVRQMGYDEALQSGAIALFGEKYGDTVRVLKFDDFSTELCGGTHVGRTGDIGLFKIVSETGVAAGVRRIEAATGAAALAHMNDLAGRLDGVARLVKGSAVSAGERVRQLLERNRRLEKDLENLKQRLASGQSSDLSEQAVDVAGIKVLASQLDGADAKTLRSAVDRLKDQLGSAAIVLAAVDGDTVRLVAGITGDQTKHLNAGALIQAIADRIGGKGGGRADLAQAGGGDPARLPEALANVPDWVREQLATAIS